VKILSALAAGLIFGFGLTLSGMVNPARVLGFLDFAGEWDPTLAFVLAGAVLASAVGYGLMGRFAHPVFEGSFAVPTSRDIDLRLVGGSALFGIGWGLAGFCPGPAVASLSLGLGKSVLFVAAMLVGMVLFRLLPSAAPRARHA
jgi:uncharacterized membrane protein YedE/YeeE